MRYGDEGEHVRRMQLALERAGYELTKYGADGDFGRETRMALYRFTIDQGFRWVFDAPVPEPILDALGVGEIRDEPACAFGPCQVDTEGVTLYDLRDEAPDPHPRSRVRGGKTSRRSASAITGIVLHQTAVKFGQPSGTIDQLSLARRAHRVACHAMAFHAGFVVLPSPLAWYIYHADRLNSTTLGIEVDGNYPGLLGGKVQSGEETPMTQNVVRAARTAVKMLVTEGRRAGMPIRYIYAHRQADAWRRADPGEGLWRRVVLEYAVPVLGLETRPAFTIPHPKSERRDGWPVPKRWDPEGVGAY